MEELDLLKKAWQKENYSSDQVSEGEIYKMLHQKSSSIVKWILIISIIEFIFWNFITVFITDDNYINKLKQYGIENLMLILNIVNYIIIIGFIIVFYKNYRSISITDATQQLMKNILKTKKTVQNYIWYNLAMIAISIIITLIMLFNHNPKMISLMDKEISQGHHTYFICICTLISILFIILIIGLFWLFYRLIYGILLKKLFANYKELKKIDL